MKISRRNFDEKLPTELTNGVVLKRITNDEDLEIEFDTCKLLTLHKVRNVRNTERCDLIVVESEFTSNILLCGGVLAYVVSRSGEILSEFETGYRKENAPPIEYRADFCGFETISEGNALILIWDYGVLVLDQKFEEIAKAQKYADDILQEVTPKQVSFENQSTNENWFVKLQKSR